MLAQHNFNTQAEFIAALRDWFAGQALPQAVEDYGQPNSSGGQQRKNHGNPVLPYSAQAIGTREEIIARQAYRYADAMLSARKGGPDEA